METINDRIRALREELGLSQTAFGEPIGLSRDEVKNIEYKKTAPKEITVPLICKEYKVRREWLYDGVGPMRTEKDADDDLAKIFEEIGASDDNLIKAIVRSCWQLNDSDKAAVRKMVDELGKKKSPGAGPGQS